jgi:enamine deaminase RidA (YjgF/YER057c/UK114 family)
MDERTQLALATHEEVHMADFPKRIASPGGEVVIASERGETMYNSFKFAPARRADRTLYVSGVIAGPARGEGRDVEAFRAQLRRAFGEIGSTLAAGGAGFSNVAMINTFHVWTSDNFQGDRNAQLGAFIEVKDEFMPPPHPAWTAVGTTCLALDTGVVEIQVIAHL